MVNTTNCTACATLLCMENLFKPHNLKSPYCNTTSYSTVFCIMLILILFVKKKKKSIKFVWHSKDSVLCSCLGLTVGCVNVWVRVFRGTVLKLLPK